jgi:hypothetical protein
MGRMAEHMDRMAAMEAFVVVVDTGSFSAAENGCPRAPDYSGRQNLAFVGARDERK